MSTIVGISGVSGAGKTTISEALSRALGGVTVIHWDDYDGLTRGPKDYVEWHNRNGSHNEWIATDLESTLKQLKAGHHVSCPATGKVLLATPYVIFDTGLGYSHSQTGKYIDYLFFIQIPADVNLCRRLIRDFKCGYLKSGEEIIKELSFYIFHSRPVYIASMKQEKADFIIDGLKPVIENISDIVSFLSKIDSKS